jgi:threonine/homoserine/homoserine lactone efflux protein
MVVGFTVSLPPGPVAFEIIKRGLGRGFIPAFPLGIGAALADLTYSTLVFCGMIKLINSNPLIKSLIYLIGGILLLLLGVYSSGQILRGNIHIGVKVTEDDISDDKLRVKDKTIFDYIWHFIKRLFLGYTMTIFNPAGFLFFLTLFPPIFAKVVNSGSAPSAYLFVLGFPLGVIFLFTLEALFASMFKKFLNESTFKRVAIVLNFGLIVTGGYFLFSFFSFTA